MSLGFTNLSKSLHSPWHSDLVYQPFTNISQRMARYRGDRRLAFVGNIGIQDLSSFDSSPSSTVCLSDPVRLTQRTRRGADPMFDSISLGQVVACQTNTASPAFWCVPDASSSAYPLSFWADRSLLGCLLWTHASRIRVSCHHGSHSLTLTRSG